MQTKKQNNVFSIQNLTVSIQTIIKNPTNSKQLIANLNNASTKNHQKIRQVLQQSLQKKEYQKGMVQILDEFCQLCGYFKEYQTSKLIIEIFFQKYMHLIKKFGGSLDKLQFWNRWKQIPLSCLLNYIQSFNLQKFIEDEQSYKVHALIKDLVLNNKIKDAAFYYVLFKKKDQFIQNQIFLPKLKIGEEIYSPFVLKLFQYSPELLHNIIKVLDPHASIKLIQLMNLKVDSYPEIIKYLSLEYYKHHIKEFKDWYKIQEKLSYDKQFVEMYANQNLQGQIKESVLARLGKPQYKETIKNPLFQFDAFIYTQKILHKNLTDYWSLQDDGITEKDIHFIDDDSIKLFQEAIQKILSSRIIGFDSQFKATSHKYQEDGASILQIACRKQIFIFDIIILKNSKRFLQMIKTLFVSTQIIKVGHTIKADLLELIKNLKFNIEQCKNFADIVNIFKDKYPKYIHSSLSFITKVVTNKQLSKYQQRSNWNKRPLRKCQLHYAALDAYICLYLYDVLLKGQINVNQVFIENNLTIKKIQNLDYFSCQNFSYGIQYKSYLENPKFLVDNMLKKLSSYLRNLGLDSENINQKDFERAIALAKQGNRIILTKDKTLRKKKNIRIPVYLISSIDAESMAREIIQFFKIDKTKFNTLSRCVKCNSDQLKVIDPQEAMKMLNFKYQGSDIKEFWECGKCKQIYWEGGQFIKAKKRFEAFK